MNKKLLIFLSIIILVATGFFLILRQNLNEQQVLQSTYDISKEYLFLRYRTDNILLNAKKYVNYSTWDKDMTVLIEDWEALEKESQKLNNSASKAADALANNFKLIKPIYAYSAKEVSNIYDKAPKFKGIAAIAKHFGVDAKRAQVILDKAQAEISSGVFTEEGDAFETLENTAIVVKDGCKVAGFVGGVVLTGGVAGVATAGTLTQTAIVVTGVDLALEVTEDGAQIAFGDKNKVSSFVKDVRTVTEPIANVLTITNIPSNLGNAFGKFDSVMIGLEQFRASAQEGKVIGIDLTNFEYQKPFQRIRQVKYPGTVSAAEMEMAEVETWLKSLNKKYETMTQQEVEDFLKGSSKEPVKDKNSVENVKEVNNGSIGKTDNAKGNINIEGFGWKGTLTSVSGGNNEEQNTELDFILNKDGTVGGGNFKKWKQEGNTIKLFGEDEKSGYYEFTVSENSLTLSKMLIGDEEISPGQEYMGGIAASGVLYKSTVSKSDDSKKGKISFSEWDAWGDADSRYKDDLIEEFGNPDITETKSGKQMWVYSDLVINSSGRTCSPVYTFYETDQTATRRCLSAENVKSIINQ